MSQPITPETAHLFIGRVVRIVDRRDSRTGAPGRLIGVDHDKGIVERAGRRTGMTERERIPLKDLNDWTSRNNGPVLIPPAPEPPKLVKLPEMKYQARVLLQRSPDLVTVQPLTMTEKQDMQKDIQRAEVRSALDVADELEMGDLGARIRQAVEDVRTATTMLADAKAKLGVLRGKAEKLLAMCQEGK